MPRGHVFRGLLLLSWLSANFSSCSVMHATDGTIGTVWGPFSWLSLHIDLWGGRLGSGELQEDNSSSVVMPLSPGKIGSLPLLCLTGGA